MPIIQIDNHSLTYHMRRSRRAKRLQLIFRMSTFEVVSPFVCSNQQVLNFVWQHRQWMVKQHTAKNQQISLMTWPKEFVTGEEVPFRAASLKLNVKFSRNAAINLQNDSLNIFLAWENTFCGKFSHQVKEQLIYWYQQQANAAIHRAIQQYCPDLGRWPSGFALKQQKTRWGSCGIQQKIYLNWLLILAPLGVLEYVVVHELCHLFHRNHGKRFWAKVAKCMPHYEQYEKWLNQHGGALLSLS